MPQNIYLIGFMGSGKSHWAKIWSKEYNRTAVDLDVILENYFQKKIPDIFKENGEELFRQKESEFLKKTVDFDNQIIACGGGAPIFFDNMDWMLANGIVVYLAADARLLASRLEKESQNRPLLKSYKGKELLDFIQSKLEEREPFYRRADYTLDAAKLNEKSLLF